MIDAVSSPARSTHDTLLLLLHPLLLKSLLPEPPLVDVLLLKTFLHEALLLDMLLPLLLLLDTFLFNAFVLDTLAFLLLELLVLKPFVMDSRFLWRLALSYLNTEFGRFCNESRVIIGTSGWARSIG